MKKKTAFCDLYKTISPGDFVYLFRGEYPQTIAYILSFCPKKSYAEKVIQLLGKAEEDRLEPGDRYSFVIREYLQRCTEDRPDRQFLSEVEAEVSGMLASFKEDIR